MSDNTSTASSSTPPRADGDLQLQLKNLAPLKNARPCASRGASAAPGDTLKHILDSVPFTPSQGVRTPSPRRSHDQRLARPTANPVFQFDDFASPPAVGHDLSVGQVTSWSSGHVVSDHGGTGWFPPSPARPTDVQLYGAYQIQSPRSHSQASNSSGSPRAMQAETFIPISSGGPGYQVASNRQAAQRMHGRDHSPIRPLVHQFSRTTLASSFSAITPFPQFEDSLAPGVYHGHGIASAGPEQGGHGHGAGQRGTCMPPQRPSRFPPVAPVPPLLDSRSPGQRLDNRSCAQPSPQRGLKLRKDHSFRGDSTVRPGTSTASSGSHGGLQDEVASAKQAGTVNGRREMDTVSTSTESPNPGSPTQQVKSKIEVKLSSDGHLVFNARQRRTLRRALQRQRRQDIPDGRDFSLDVPLTHAERRIVVDVVQMHIGRPLPECTNIDDLLRVLLSLGTTDADG